MRVEYDPPNPILIIADGVLISQVACSSLTSMVHEPTFSEKLSRQIYHAVNEVLPESVRGLPESIRGQIARFQH